MSFLINLPTTPHAKRVRYVAIVFIMIESCVVSLRDQIRERAIRLDIGVEKVAALIAGETRRIEIHALLDTNVRQPDRRAISPKGDFRRLLGHMFRTRTNTPCKDDKCGSECAA